MPTEFNPAATNDDQQPRRDDECLLYLFGELNDQEKIDFERRLSCDPVLDSTLERLSISIADAAAELADGRTVQPSDLASVVGDLPSGNRWLRYAGFLATTAAGIGLAIGVFGSRLRVDRQETLIAQIWADQQSDAVDSTTVVDWTSDDVDVADPLLGRSDSDETLEWMYAAILIDPAATTMPESTDSSVPGGSNDG